MRICDPIRTPFSNGELRRIAMGSQRLPHWVTPDFFKRSYVDPDDPAQRIKLHNFWDVILATCTVALIACGERLDQAYRVADAFTELLAAIVDRGLAAQSHLCAQDPRFSCAFLILTRALERGSIKGEIAYEVFGVADDEIIACIQFNLSLLLEETLRASRQCISTVQNEKFDESLFAPTLDLNALTDEDETEWQLPLFPPDSFLSA